MERAEGGSSPRGWQRERSQESRLAAEFLTCPCPKEILLSSGTEQDCCEGGYAKRAVPAPAALRLLEGHTEQGQHCWELEDLSGLRDQVSLTIGRWTWAPGGRDKSSGHGVGLPSVFLCKSTCPNERPGKANEAFFKVKNEVSESFRGCLDSA